MRIVFSPQAKDDLDFWIKSGDKTITKKIIKLIESIKETPFQGIGKPEPLKHQLTGYWSRRINKEHRLIYQVNQNNILIFSAKGHYL